MNPGVSGSPLAAPAIAIPERCVSTSDRLPSIGRSGKKSEPITISQEARGTGIRIRGEAGD